MKTILRFIFIISVLIFSVNASIALNGSYTVGAGGDFPTIDSAVSTAQAQGLGGPVIFNIKSGIYNEEIILQNIFGLSFTNNLTFQSETGNAADVIINGNVFVFQVKASFVIFQNLTIGSSSQTSFQIYSSYTTIKNNIFTNDSKGILTFDQFPPRNIEITGNTNVPGIGLNPWRDYQGQNVIIKNNSVSGGIVVYFYLNVLIENNITKFINTSSSSNATISKNKVNGTIECGGGYYNIFNNFLFSDSPNDSAIFSNAIGNVIYNTFSYSSRTSIILFGDSTTFLNNLMINKSGRYSFYVYSGGPFFGNPKYSDYNNFYNNGNTGLIKWHNDDFDNVSSYFNATGNDEHSNSHPVTFVSPTDLHLAGSSLGDQQLAGIPTSLVLDDIDGQPRDPSHPYKGADEYIDFPLPVELASFTSSVSNNRVNLKWTTSSEINNSGFDIERSFLKNSISEDWLKVGSQTGNGTTNYQSSYEFNEKDLLPGKYYYRLKQIDYNGNFRYHNLTGEIVIGIPDKFTLSQNYPNPFNPKTVISFGLQLAGRISIKIYDVNGKEISSLVNQSMEAGFHTTEFDGSNFSSGVYFYVLNFEGKNIDRKRMVLLK